MEVWIYLHAVASGLSAYADRQNLMRATWGRTCWGVVCWAAGLVVAGPLVSGEYIETLNADLAPDQQC